MNQQWWLNSSLWRARIRPHILTHRDKMAATLADDIFMCNFVSENVLISMEKSLNIVRKDPFGNKSALVQVMAWRRTGEQSPDGFFFLFCMISVWIIISIQIPEGMDGPMWHETSARCRANRSVKQSNGVLVSPNERRHSCYLFRLQLRPSTALSKAETDYKPKRITYLKTVFPDKGFRL